MSIKRHKYSISHVCNCPYIEEHRYGLSPVCMQLSGMLNLKSHMKLDLASIYNISCITMPIKGHIYKAFLLYLIAWDAKSEITNEIRFSVHL